MIKNKTVFLLGSPTPFTIADCEPRPWPRCLVASLRPAVRSQAECSGVLVVVVAEMCVMRFRDRVLTSGCIDLCSVATPGAVVAVAGVQSSHLVILLANQHVISYVV